MRTGLHNLDICTAKALSFDVEHGIYIPGQACPTRATPQDIENVQFSTWRWLGVSQLLHADDPAMPACI